MNGDVYAQGKYFNLWGYLTFLRLLAVFGFVASAACVLPASAQLSGYATVAATDYGYTLNSAFSNGNYGFKGLSGGLLAGGTYNFAIQSRVTVGLDVRGDYAPGSKGGEFFATDLRVGFVPKKNPLRPFFGLGGGVVTTGHTTNLFNSATRSTSGGLLIDLGLDVRLTEHFDYRVLDYGAIAGSTVGTGFIATGVVYHFSPGGH